MDARKNNTEYCEFREGMPQHLVNRLLEEGREGRKFSGLATPCADDTGKH